MIHYNLLFFVILRVSTPVRREKLKGDEITLYADQDSPRRPGTRVGNEMFQKAASGKVLKTSL